jgi:hypothetical protein
MAIFGWDTLKEAEKYTAKADRQRLAQAAMHLLDGDIRLPVPNHHISEGPKN